MDLERRAENVRPGRSGGNEGCCGDLLCER